MGLGRWLYLVGIEFTSRLNGVERIEAATSVWHAWCHTQYAAVPSDCVSKQANKAMRSLQNGCTHSRIGLEIVVAQPVSMKTLNWAIRGALPSSLGSCCAHGRRQSPEFRKLVLRSGAAA